MNVLPAHCPARLRGALVALSVLALTACATPYGGLPGSGYPGSAHPGGAYPGGYGAQAVLGTVQQVDPGYGRIVIDADAGGSGGVRPMEVFYDRETRLVYQGREYPVEGLERGDRIRVETSNAGGRLHARFIEVVQNVRDAPGGGYYGGGLEGAVRFVDPRARLIEISRGGYSGRSERVFYDERTQVEHRGRWLRPEQLEPGDVIRVQARPMGQDWMAERITVEVDARSRYP
jgi:hypothetical protein